MRCSWHIEFSESSWMCERSSDVPASPCAKPWQLIPGTLIRVESRVNWYETQLRFCVSQVVRGLARVGKALR